jgi:redox-sensitive bicupin YhaK (pirin superfamily)
MAIKRKIVKVETPQGQPGFLGAGHTARPVVSGHFSDSDPFFILMDDLIDKKDYVPVGGPHPHAGFETVTLLLEGELGDAAYKMHDGDFQLMTAGSGIVHAEIIDKPGKMRILQLWLNLPQKNSAALPRIQYLPLALLPASNENGVHIKLYSGSLAGLTSPVQNYVPLIIADITMEPGVTTVQQIPANYNTFMYVLNGAVKVGENEQLLTHDQIGWLNLLGNDAQSELLLTTTEEGARFVLYAGKPLGENIISHGPFIADSSEDILRLYTEYRQGKMQHISTVPEEQKIRW